jgi:DNA repair exonuclease SbcCD nuclease subunit
MDTHAVLRSELMTEFYKHLDSLWKKNKYILVGNHDQLKPNDATYNSLFTFKDIKNTLIINTTTHIEIGKTKVVLVPFINKHEQWEEIKDTNIVFCHETFLGCTYDGDRLSEGGRSFDNIESDLIISGHIHTKQVLGDKVIYPGTPLATSCSDANQEKGLMILDLDTYKFKMIPTIFPKWLKHTIELDSNVDLSFRDLSEKDHHVVTLKGTKAEIKSAMLSNDLIESRKRLSIQIKTEAIDKVKEKTKTIKVDSIKSMIYSYIDSIYEGSIDKDELKELLKEYTNE